jgi:2-phospho-L-lactate/phosphoenolpyruvate guanylyltransferase
LAGVTVAEVAAPRSIMDCSLLSSPVQINVPDARRHAPARERVVAILPLRALDDGKRRLSGRLDAPARRELITRLCGVVVRALRESGVIDHVAVVSGDDATLRWAREQGLAAVREHGRGLNAALVDAAAWARNMGADAQLIVLPDLPLLEAEDVRAVLHAPAPERGIVICGDRTGTGTNMLLMRPCGVIPPHFGPGSFARHLEAAQRAGIAAHVCDLARTRWDIDTPDDLDELAGGAI